MSKQTTDIVYLCSPDRDRQLTNSIKTLIRSETRIDGILIYCIGQYPAHWTDLDARVTVREVQPLFGDYFYGNKLYLCDSNASRVVYLDTDSFVLRSLHEIWRNRSEDFLARPGTKNTDPAWKTQVWKDTLSLLGSDEIPMFNTGFLVFQNRSHQRIKDRWARYIEKYISEEFHPPYRDQRMREQWALSLAIGASKTKYGLLGSNEHAFGWMSEDPANAIVYHTGNQNYDIYAQRFGGL